MYQGAMALVDAHEKYFVAVRDFVANLRLSKWTITSNQIGGSIMPGIKPTMTDEEKMEYKKSVARMMFFWIINTRDTWRHTVLDNKPNEWGTLSLTTEFKDTGGVLNGEWLSFFSSARSVVNLTQVRESLGAINALAEGFWVEPLDPDCPADEIINRMYEEAAEYVDAIPNP